MLWKGAIGLATSLTNPSMISNAPFLQQIGFTNGHTTNTRLTPHLGGKDLKTLSNLSSEEKKNDGLWSVVSMTL